MRNNSQFKLYVRSTGHNLVQRLRKTSIGSKYEKHDDEEANIGECSRYSNNDDFETYGNMQNRPFRKISISKRQRRSKNSVSGFTKLYDLDEEVENEGEDNEEIEMLSIAMPSMMSLKQKDRIQDLDEDLAVLEEKGYYMESDIEEEDDDQYYGGSDSSGASNADCEDSSSSESD